jgi:serine/threonine protein kinase
MPSKLDNYVCTKTLGEGISAKVKLATDQNNGQIVALKIFDKSDPKNDAKAIRTIRREVEVYSNLEHRHLVRLIDFKEDATWERKSGNIKVAYMALELITGGTLFDFVVLGPFNAKISRYYFKQMLQAMHYIHSKSFVHRDLKPENIMLDDKFDLKIADFGFAAPVEGRDGSGTLRTQLGTQGY